MKTESQQYERLDAIINKRTERGIEENDPLADALERELRGEESCPECGAMVESGVCQAANCKSRLL
jgi:recombinational DNA repair protein RecR